jgi:serine/threonine protein kinase
VFAEGASRDSSEDLIGRVVDSRYKILEAMASGSMGAVFKAERIPVGKLVAIKFLHSSFANDSEFLTRFERETRVMSKLAHPNCVSVVDFGVWEGAPYLVMEYVAGKTLRQILDAGPMMPYRALGIAKQIAAGLAHAHAQGITHRDVKPANIMITEEIGTGEHVRLLDFGLARLRGAVGRDATQTNVVVGTPNYMAPEQTVGGSTIDARTDVYAVGVVLFEMIAGQRPFQAEDTLALLGMHRAAPIPKLADRVDRTMVLPPGTQDLIDTAMAKAPEDRFQSAVELAEAIDALMAPSRTPPPGGIVISPTQRLKAAQAAEAHAPTVSDTSSEVSRPRRSSSKFPIILVLLVLFGGAYGAYYLNKKKPEKTNMHGDDSPKIVVDAGVTKALKPDAAEKKSTVPPVPIDAAPAIDAPTVIILPDIDAPAQDINVTNPVDLNDPEPKAEEAADPAPLDPNKKEAEDEPDNAPKSQEEAETVVDKQAPPEVKPQLATTIKGAVALIQQNKPDLALQSLNVLWKTNKNSAYIPFLLGNLYFDKAWWSVAMDHYKIAIAKNAGYKSNATLIRNVIRTLGSIKTNKRAQAFLKFTIGRPAVPYLRTAAAHDQNPHVKKWAAYMAKQIR